MAISQERKTEIIDQFARHEGDTGSPEVQIAVLTADITALNEHLREHKKRSPFTTWFDEKNSDIVVIFWLICVIKISLVTVN
ncbi:SSU ribosomal protein S15p (S13e) [Tetragenococcus muriaticus PMC-11-5]|uniref:30S ribosomal protein S15 n=1 Tax=Tetragenococcus muriaticus PMC-11-5 TaxID=1302649 RepID=A0A091C8P4_9ENTE|nr:SSU ribosomal protein S15p (S13e) [Tetragenococcus muriaticus PMC-11-5]